MRRLGLCVAVAVLLGLAGCSSHAAGDEGGTAESGQRATDELSGSVTVFAAASLTDVFDQLKGDFQRAHPNVGVRINYGPSSGLAQSIVQGAPADVFASANETQMTVVTDAGMASDPSIFTSNVL